MSGRRALAFFAALLLVAGCSNREAPTNKRPHTGTGTASSIGGTQQIVVTTGVDLRFHPATIVVHPGLVRLVLNNVATNGTGPPHDIVVSGLPAADVPLTTAGRTTSVTFTAPAPGTYNFVCTIHANQGQTGKLVVKP